MKVDENEFRCKVCGGQLTVEDPELGIVKCINCTNRSRMDGDLTNLMSVKQIYRPQQIMQNMTDNQVEKVEKDRKRRNVVYSFKALIAILALIVVGMLIPAGFSADSNVVITYGETTYANSNYKSIVDDFFATQSHLNINCRLPAIWSPFIQSLSYSNFICINLNSLSRRDKFQSYTFSTFETQK